MLMMLVAATLVMAPDTDRVAVLPVREEPLVVRRVQPLRYELPVAVPVGGPVSVQQEGPFEYSDAYGTRLKIHKIASLATVPLFVGQYLVGDKLLEGEGSTTTKSLHSALAGGVAGLFAVNTVTGVWNLLEARKDPEARGWRTVHGLLMLAADAGFVATGVAANSSDKGTHRDIALGSMGVALVGYAMMLPPFRKD